MKYQVLYSKHFIGQYRKLNHCGNSRILQTLDVVINKLENGIELLPQNHNHKLVGKLKGLFECHVLPDWLLIYRFDNDIMILELMATGTHSNLFR